MPEPANPVLANSVVVENLVKRFGDLTAIARPRGRRQIARKSERELGFDNTHKEAAGREARGTIEGRSREQAAIERFGHTQQSLRDSVGACDFVAYDVAAIMAGQPLDEARLACIRLIEAGRSVTGRKFPESSALDIRIQ